MEEIMILYAKLIPEEQLLDDIHESLTAYKIAQTPETKKKFVMNLVLCSTKFITEEKSLEETLKKFKETQAAKNLFNKSEQ